MAEDSKIQWCDHTFNPWRGCARVAAGCVNCYAEAQSKRNEKLLGRWGLTGTRVLAAEEQWNAVRRWDRRAIAAGKAGVVFNGSMCDVFEDNDNPVLRHDGSTMWGCPECGVWRDGALPEVQRSPVWCYRHTACRPLTIDDVRQRLFKLIASTRLHHLLLTKRPWNIRRFWPSVGFPYAGVPGTLGRHVCFENVWLGTSIACREDLKNARYLASCRDLCAGTFWSIEPLIEDLGQIFPTCMYCEEGYQDPATGLVECGYCDGTGIDKSIAPDQVIIGGESGPNARPCDIDWIRSIARQCAEYDVLCFVKQVGSVPLMRQDSVEGRRAGDMPEFEWPDGTRFGTHPRFTDESLRGRFVCLKDKKGGDPSEWPDDLQIFRSLCW